MLPKREPFTGFRDRGTEWVDSRDYRGSDFRQYITPDFYEQMRGTDTSEYLSLMANNKVFALNSPQNKLSQKLIILPLIFHPNYY